MSTQHYQPGRLQPPRVLVIHATAGSFPGDLDWLKKGGSTAYPVSCHYLVNKAGEVFQFVNEEDTAWHAGNSSWVIDGVKQTNLNKWSLGIELSNANSGYDPYPQVQIDAAVDLARDIVQRHNIPRSQLVRHLDISPGRKSDPAGMPWIYFTTQVYQDMASHTRVIGVRPDISLARFLDILTRRGAPFGEHVQTIGTRIYQMCDWLDIDPAFWLAVWTHEQGTPLGSSEIGKQTRNPLNIKAYGRWPSIEAKSARWNVYESWQLGCMASLLHLKQFYGAQGLFDVEAIIPIFAPSSDRNVPDRYIAAVLNDMRAMQEE